MEYRRQLEQQISEKRMQREKLKKQLDTCNSLLYADTRDYGILLQYAGFETLTKEMADAFIEKIAISNEKAINIYWKFNKNDGSIFNSVTTILQHPSADEAIM